MCVEGGSHFSHNLKEKKYWKFVKNVGTSAKTVFNYLEFVGWWYKLFLIILARSCFFAKF